MTVHFPFDNSYSRLPDRFFARQMPAVVAAPKLIRLNRDLAVELGLDPEQLSTTEGIDILAGRTIPNGAEPIATAYAGHQFGNFVPQLGDGRALLLGEVVGRDGVRRDIQLKGSGRTPFSRTGDGRSALGPVLREYVVSEAMAALGVRTTRSLAAVSTGETVVREVPLPGAVLTRVASSHIRVGTFQFFAARGDFDAVRLLADHVIVRHYPEAAVAERPYQALLEAVVRAQADLVAQWMLIGFIHGVMNTDNMSIAGETIDYGPCAFMDEYNPQTVLSSIDAHGRYAYGNQPSIAHWNLVRLAETLLPLMSPEPEVAVKQAEEALSVFETVFSDALFAGLSRKLGLVEARDTDRDLARDFLNLMNDNGADFTLAFRALADAAEGNEAPLRGRFIVPAALDPWLQRWQLRLGEEKQSDAERAGAMRAVNPMYIPRNHRIEAVIRAAVDHDDFGPFHELLAVLSRPYDDPPAFARYAEPPKPEERVLQTFCGT